MGRPEAGIERPDAAIGRLNNGLIFFQAEDGIRDASVTGVQTCALPICIGFLFLFLICLLVKIFGYAPDRQLFMLASIIFVGSGISLDELFKKLPAGVQNYSFAALIILLVVAGAFSLKVRKLDAADRTANIKI